MKMRIEHVAMYVSDLEDARKFFEKYFGAVANDKYTNRRTGFQSYFLSFEGGARLEIMRQSTVRDYDGKQQRMGYIHLAFSVGSKEKVDELTRQLSADGYQIISGPRTTGDGYYESRVQGFEDNLIEITV